ncbi:MAG: HIT domain-containing protein [archaeon]
MVSDGQIVKIAKSLQGLSPEEQQKKFQELVFGMSPEEQKEIIEKLSGSSQECIFCSMAEGKVAIKKIYEDDKVIAVLEINPATKGHVLVFPKKHYSLLNQVEDDLVGHLFKVANKLSGVIFENVGAEGTNIVVSSGAVAGQRIPHVVVNVIPRFKGDNVSVGWKGNPMDEEELEELRKKLSGKVRFEKPKQIKEIKFQEEEPRIP